jgi:extradiol dioxygenase family protein
MSLRPFHVAVPVHSLTAAREFYGDLLECTEGRSAERWVDFNLYGHQVVCHQIDALAKNAGANRVDGEAVPVPHYGVVLNWPDWERLADRLRSHNEQFIVEPGVRFTGEPGEQATLFIADPSGNVLEFKAMRNPDNLFRHLFRHG